MWWCEFSHAYTIVHEFLVYKQKCRKCQNGFLKSTKYGFSHDYFLHMWPPSRVRNLKPNECK